MLHHRRKRETNNTIFSTILLGVFTLSLLVSPAFAQAVLTHGPVFGGVSFSNANVFVRTDQVATVELRFGDDSTLSTFSSTDPVQTASSDDFTAIIPLSQLKHNKIYYIDVLVDGVSQFSEEFPSFKTFKSRRTPVEFKFIYLTDFVNQNNVTATHPTGSFVNAGLEDSPTPAFAFIGGDFDHRNPSTLFAKRNMFKDLYDPNSIGLTEFNDLILRQMPIVHQWDDHDVGTNNVDKTYPDWDLSYKAYKEYIPSYPTPYSRFAIWQKFRYAHADFFVLDTRSHRDVNTDPDDNDKSMLDGYNLASQMWGQLVWLKWYLKNSQARWKIIFTSVVANPYTKFDDGWAGFQTEWNELKNHIEDNGITGVVFLSADLHIGGIDNGSASGFVEMTVPQVNQVPTSISSCASGPVGLWSEGVYGARYGANGGPCAGYGVVTVLTDPDRLHLEIKDQDGNTQIAYTVF